MQNIDTKIKKKDVYWQCIRGICILCVVLIHCKNGISYKDMSYLSWNFEYWLIMRQVINFPVAMFIFLAGYFTNVKRVQESNLKYILSRVGRLLIPYLTWSLLYMIAKIFLLKEPIDIIKAIVRVFLGLSSGHLYFILVLLQLTCITPFLIKIIQNNYKVSKLLFIITPLYLLILYIYNAIFKEQLLFYQVFFPAWFVFYYFGLWTKIKGYRSVYKKHIFKKAIICCAFALLASIIEGYVLLRLKFSLEFISSQIKLTSFIYAFTLINLSMVAKPYFCAQKDTYLSYIGDYSYGIYYVHMIWIIIGNNFLQKISIINEVLFYYQFLQLLFTVIFSLISILLTRKILGERISSKLLGF